MHELRLAGKLNWALSLVFLLILVVCAAAGLAADTAADLWWQGGLWIMLGCLAFALPPVPTLFSARGLIVAPKAQSPPLA